MAQILRRYSEACGAAGVFELRVRMLADATSELAGRAQGDLDPLTKAVRAHFATDLSDEDGAFLLRCPGLRNKLFHADLSKARGRVSELIPGAVYPGGVWQGDLAAGTARKVAGTSVQTGRLFGWLLELASGGDLEAIHVAMTRGRRILEELATRVAAQGVTDESAPLDGERLRALVEGMQAGLAMTRSRK